jgi:hypothetical protein
MIMRGDDELIVPTGASVLLPSKLASNATLKVFP